MSPRPRALRVAIVGGGAIGSAIAYFLTRDDRECAVTVIERDPRYQQASSALSASSIRQQFSTAVNIRMSRYGIEFFRSIGDTLAVDGDRPAIGLVEPGYLYLATADGAAALRANHATQRAEGVDVALLEPATLAARFPWLATGDLALGSLGLSGEGWYDGYAVLQAFRRKAIAQGVCYRRAAACGFERTGSGAAAPIRAVRLADGGTVDCDIAVDAAGPWAASVAGWAGIALPVHARRRSVFVFRCPAPIAACPLVIDPGGLWFRPEGGRFICGDAPPPAQDLDDLPLDPDLAAFEDRLWPALAARVPAFEAIRMTNAWAGYYEMNAFDHNALLGVHPACPNLYFAAGFSGHGLQQSP
ncbi:MAG: NAD(P)/FAD-dependent oxidoreductase, partial [Lautropia sp.]